MNCCASAPSLRKRRTGSLLPSPTADSLPDKIPLPRPLQPRPLRTSWLYKRQHNRWFLLYFWRSQTVWTCQVQQVRRTGGRLSSSERSCMSGKRTAIVTGASGGIGGGLVEGFLKEGYNVVATSRGANQRLTASRGLVLLEGDIGKRQTAADAVETAIKK